MAPDTRHHHRTARSHTLVTVSNANTTGATATGPETLPTFPTPTTLDVLVVPGIRDTLLAASQVAKTSDILIQQDEVFIEAKSPRPLRKDIRAIGLLRNGMYENHMPVTTNRQPVTRNVHANMTHITSTLHNTFNHAPATTLRRLVQHYRGTANLSKPRDPADVDCHSCAQGNQTRAPFPAIHRPPPAPLDVISTDTAESLPRSHDNVKYLKVLHDRTTRFLLTVPLPSKSAATVAIQHAIARLQRNTGRTVRRYHADNARKKHAEPLCNFLLRQGTEMTSTTPHTSQQNPHAERAIKKIFNTARSTLAQSKLDYSFWTYAAADATRKHNALPTTLDGVASSPHERLFGTNTKFDISNLLPFGHRGFVTATGVKTKLEAREYPARYLYQLNDAQYLVLNTLTKSVKKCRIPEFHLLRHASTNTTHHVSACTTPKTLRAALNSPDAYEWATAYDEELDLHQHQLGTWRLEPRLPGDTPRRPLFKFRQNLIPTALHQARKCAVRFEAIP
jgi:hypothetical protein